MAHISRIAYTPSHKTRGARMDAPLIRDTMTRRYAALSSIAAVLARPMRKERLGSQNEARAQKQHAGHAGDNANVRQLRHSVIDVIDFAR